MSVMSDREEDVDFTVPFYDLVGISILMRKHEDGIDLFSFFFIFDLEVWLVIISTFFFTGYI